MKVSIFGTGYVGLVTGACLADVGHEVMCVDIDANKIERLRRGHIPIWEPDLDSLVIRNVNEGRLHFDTDAARAVHHAELQIIAVGTPPDEDGSADLRHVLAVAQTVGRHMSEHKIIVTKSTVPVGTAQKINSAVREEIEARGTAATFDIVSNPEFLKEGAAIADFMKPDRIVIGAYSGRSRTPESVRREH